MAVNDYVDINLDDIPCQFDYTFDGQEYTLNIHYNELNDSYYIDIYDENMVPIVLGEKLVYGYQLWNSVNDPRLPMINLVPFDESNIESEVSKLNFTDSVRLYIKDTDIISDDTPVTDDADDDSEDDGVEPDYVDADDTDYGNDRTVGGNS